MCSLLIDAHQLGAIVIVVIRCETLSTIDCHDLTCAKACIVRGQEKQGLCNLSRRVQLPGKRDISGCLLQVTFVLFWSQFHTYHILSIGPSFWINGACGHAINSHTVIGRFKSGAFDQLLNHRWCNGHDRCHWVGLGTLTAGQDGNAWLGIHLQEGNS